MPEAMGILGEALELEDHPGSRNHGEELRVR
jgi:hypothetical protein